MPTIGIKRKQVQRKKGMKKESPFPPPQKKKKNNNNNKTNKRKTTKLGWNLNTRTLASQKTLHTWEPYSRVLQGVTYNDC